MFLTTPSATEVCAQKNEHQNKFDELRMCNDHGWTTEKVKEEMEGRKETTTYRFNALNHRVGEGLGGALMFADIVKH